MADETAKDVAVRQIKLLATHSDRLKALIEEAKKIAPGLTLHEVTEKLVVPTGIEEKTLWDIFNAIDQISSMSKNLGGVDKALSRLFETFGKEQLQELDTKKETIAAALELYNSDNPVAVSLKARKLAFLRENLFLDGEIITDARPVYDTSGEKILEFVITHTLALTYQTHRESERIHFAMDAEDIVKLRSACDRAVIKARALKETLGDKARVLADDV